MQVAYIFSSQRHIVSHKLGKLVDGATIGCFPNLYEALAGNMPDQFIALQGGGRRHR